jgi:hypothetical protein
MATIAPLLPAEFIADLEFPQREAAFFYGLFLRGHSPEQLRRDIEVPATVLACSVSFQSQLEILDVVFCPTPRFQATPERGPLV